MFLDSIPGIGSFHVDPNFSSSLLERFDTSLAVVSDYLPTIPLWSGVSVRIEPIADPHQYGSFTPGILPTIVVSSANPSGFIHEVGHLLGRSTFGYGNFQESDDFLDLYYTWRRLVADVVTDEYLLQPSEVFARMYDYWVLTRFPNDLGRTLSCVTNHAVVSELVTQSDNFLGFDVLHRRIEQFFLRLKRQGVLGLTVDYRPSRPFVSQVNQSFASAETLSGFSVSIDNVDCYQSDKSGSFVTFVVSNPSGSEVYALECVVKTGLDWFLVQVVGLLQSGVSLAEFYTWLKPYGVLLWVAEGLQIGGKVLTPEQKVQVLSERALSL